MFELVLRIAFSLLVVFGLMWGLARVARRGGIGRSRSGGLAVLNRQQIGRGSAVAVVQVADRALILGVTDNQVNLLGETDLEAFDHHKHEAGKGVRPDEPHPTVIAHHPSRLEGSVLSPRTWSSTLDFLRDRTTRR